MLLALNPLFLAADVFSDDAGVVGGDVSSPFEPMEEALRRIERARRRWPERRRGRLRRGLRRRGRLGVGRVAFGQDFGGPNGEPIVGFDEFGNPIFAGDVEDDGVPFWAVSLSPAWASSPSRRCSSPSGGSGHPPTVER